MIMERLKQQTADCFPGHVKSSLWFCNDIKESMYHNSQAILAKILIPSNYFYSVLSFFSNLVTFKMTC